MLAAVVCGVLCGARGYETLVEWLHDLPVDFWHFLGFTRTPPKKDCFRDLLMKPGLHREIEPELAASHAAFSPLRPADAAG